MFLFLFNKFATHLLSCQGDAHAVATRFTSVMLSLGIAEASVVIGFDRCLKIWRHVFADDDEGVLHHSADFLGIPQGRTDVVALIAVLGEQFEVEHVRVAIVEEGDLPSHRRPTMATGFAFETDLGDFHVAQSSARQFARTFRTQWHQHPLLTGEVTPEGQLEFRVKDQTHVGTEFLLAVVGEPRGLFVIVLGDGLRWRCPCRETGRFGITGLIVRHARSMLDEEQFVLLWNLFHLDAIVCG